MMSDHTSVDNTTVDELTGKLVLLIEESREWRETDLMHRQLAAKIKTYVRYVRSPKFGEDHGRSAGGTIVRLVSEQPASEPSLKYMERVAYELSKHGMALEYQVGEHGMPESITPSAEVTRPPMPRKPAAPPPAASVPPPPPPGPVAPAPAPPPAPAFEPPPAPVPEPPPTPAFEPPPTPAFEPPPAPAPEPPPAPEPEPLAPTFETPPAPEPEPLAPTFETPPAPEPEPLAPTFETPPAPEPEPLAPTFETPPAPESEPLAPAFESPEAPLPEPQPEPFGLEPDPWASDALPEPLAEPSPPPEFELEPSIPGLPADDEPMEAASELEYQIDSPEFLGGQGEPAGGMEALGSPQTAEGTHPPFFPEEEFGRAHPDVEEPDPFYDAEAPTAIIETSSGKQIRLDAPTHRDAAAASTEGQPSLLRAIGGAIIATFAGALVWVLLAIPAARGASPLALAVAVMVGISVRLRGNGQTMAFRIVPCDGIRGEALRHPTRPFQHGNGVGRRHQLLRASGSHIGDSRHLPGF
jgi:hypothetical protein